MAANPKPLVLLGCRLNDEHTVFLGVLRANPELAPYICLGDMDIRLDRLRHNTFSNPAGITLLCIQLIGMDEDAIRELSMTLQSPQARHLHVIVFLNDRGTGASFRAVERRIQGFIQDFRQHTIEFCSLDTFEERVGQFILNMKNSVDVYRSLAPAGDGGMPGHAPAAAGAAEAPVVPLVPGEGGGGSALGRRLRDEAPEPDAEDEDDDMTCSICMGRLSQPHTTSLGHSYHPWCIMKHWATQLEAGLPYTDPMNGVVVGGGSQNGFPTLTPNHTLRRLLERPAPRRRLGVGGGAV